MFLTGRLVRFNLYYPGKISNLDPRGEIQMKRGSRAEFVYSQTCDNSILFLYIGKNRKELLYIMIWHGIQSEKRLFNLFDNISLFT